MRVVMRRAGCGAWSSCSEQAGELSTVAGQIWESAISVLRLSRGEDRLLHQAILIRPNLPAHQHYCRRASALAVPSYPSSMYHLTAL